MQTFIPLVRHAGQLGRYLYKGKTTFSPPIDDPDMEDYRAMDIRIVYCGT